ncbi:unnamed protein product [Mytilus coruscus]|uniref:MULE transposase domain-containing protein n=1 Tax=Mytilus coruscus TaxID=42192 RepID=A0A6J8BI57_MYTCO|nr:unnamed protein product [Mytilus coruscus]
MVQNQSPLVMMFLKNIFTKSDYQEQQTIQTVEKDQLVLYSLRKLHIVSKVTKAYIIFEDRPIIPVAFLIHGRKKEKTHARFFEFVASSFPKINKTSVPFVTDREIGLVNAIRKNLPACDVLMCWNHLIKDLKFNLQQMGADQANTALYVSHLKDLLMCDSEEEYMTISKF